MATVSSAVQEVLGLLEAEGPQALGLLLTAVAPTLPVAALVELASVVAALVQQAQAGTLVTEKAQMKEAVAVADAAVDASEAASGSK